MNPKEYRDAVEWLQALESPSKPLTSWEGGFLASLNDQLDRTGNLSTRQMELLERIYAEKTD